MAELMAIGPDEQHRWRYPIPVGEKFLLGRATKTEWSVPWDNRISREHAELLFEDGQLRVRQTDSALNPIVFQERTKSEFVLTVGGTFRIGQTTFRLIDEAALDGVSRKPESFPNELGKYKVQEKLGAGGMGTVFRAYDTKLQRAVALKVLLKDHARDPDLVKRFQSEALAGAQLKHPNIVTIYDAGYDSGYSYIALELVDGTSIEELLKPGAALTIEQSLDFVRQVTAALEHAYQNGVVHRDIKPSNLLLLKDGTVKLADMGLAYCINTAPEDRITRKGTIVGTIDYMPAEQAENSRAADVRSDIYSLGCTWYEMLTGQVPFPGNGISEKLHAHASAPIPNPRKLNEDIPEATVAILHRMMAKKRADRYQTPAELQQDLKCSQLSSDGIAENILAALDDEDDVGDEMIPPVQAGHGTTMWAEHAKELPPRQPTERPSGDAIESASAKPTAQQSGVLVRCNSCGKQYRVSDKVIGGEIECKQCGKSFAVAPSGTTPLDADDKPNERTS